MSPHRSATIALLLALATMAPRMALAVEPAPAASAAATGAQDRLRERLVGRLAADAGDGTRGIKLVSRSGGGTGTEPAAAGRDARRPAAAASAAHGAKAHWAYGGATGPQAWGGLQPEFATCARGQRQSPIDIRDGIGLDLDPVQFDYRPSALRVIDNGHTVQANLGSGNAIEVNGRRYELAQFHFHRPAEERVDGRAFEMSIHLVHRDPEGRLAVVALLVDRGAQQPVVQSVWNNLPLEKGEEQRASAPVDPAGLLPADRRYYTYMGSLTTPPCTEGVLWVVMREPITLSAEQISVFTRLYPMNARPLQSAAGRLIKQSN